MQLQFFDTIANVDVDCTSGCTEVWNGCKQTTTTFDYVSAAAIVDAIAPQVYDLE